MYLILFDKIYSVNCVFLNGPSKVVAISYSILCVDKYFLSYGEIVNSHGKWKSLRTLSVHLQILRSFRKL